MKAVTLIHKIPSSGSKGKWNDNEGRGGSDRAGKFSVLL